MKALISPLEPRQNGYRVAQVSNDTFEVANPLFWIDCDNNVVADHWYYDTTDEKIKQLTEWPEPSFDPSAKKGPSSLPPTE
jgi:hypothetical protein